MSVIAPGRLIVASHNAGKIAEFRALLEPSGITVVGAGELGLAEPQETEETFSGNAALKAEAAARATGLPALADDSGLSVDALGGAPGVHSARWAGPAKDFAAAMARVLTLLREDGHRTRQARRASFIAVLALARPGAPTRLYEGRTGGTIAERPRGSEGFGYDPIFVPDDGDGRTFGEMSAAEKHGLESPLSHRARAVAAFARDVNAETG